jgi:hypothetical protein
MSMYQQGRGRVETESVILSGTSATTILDAEDNGSLIEHIRLVNTTGGAIDVTVDRYNVSATTAYVLVQEHGLAAKSTESANLSTSVYEIVMPLWLPKGWLLRVTGNTGIHVTATHVRPEGRT